jgi:ATP-binding cassette subfamily B protein
MLATGPRIRRRLVPEIVQTSAMDCGPAALKAALEGFGVPVSYGRLREACQTSVDGTSIDTLEVVARQLGLDAEQIMVPRDHLLVPEAQTLPAIVVVRTPNGLTHFVLVWSRVGPFLQLMDPASGRRWLRPGRLLDQVYAHRQRVPATAWREWVGSSEFQATLNARIRALGSSAQRASDLTGEALADPGWKSLAALDASVRMVEALARSGGVPRGAPSARILEVVIGGRAGTSGPEIPGPFWMVAPSRSEGEGEEQLILTGAVLIRLKGLAVPASEPGGGERPHELLSPELAAALREPPSRPGRDLLKLLGSDGRRISSLLLIAVAVATIGLLVEALALRGLMGLGRDLAEPEQRLLALLALSAFVACAVLLEWTIESGGWAVGRRLDTRLRIAFLEKLPRIHDRYFHSRPISDMAERSHSLRALRLLPPMAVVLARNAFELALTTVALIVLHPPGALWILILAAASLVVPFVFQPWIAECDLRTRTHSGALSRFYLDALLGLVPLRVHGAQTSLRREHESVLIEWGRSAWDLRNAALISSGVQGVISTALAALVLTTYLARGGTTGGALLFMYWVLRIPTVAQDIAGLAQQYPARRNVALRALEPLGALETDTSREASREAAGDLPPTPPDRSPSVRGVSISFRAASVVAGGNSILSGIDLEIPAGAHVGIVGPSGAGKSSLVGLLLGWHQPAGGLVEVDGEPVAPRTIEALRRRTAWVDPTVQLWNRSLLENLIYGTEATPGSAVGEVVDVADLAGLVSGLPRGMATSLGEGGALVSGGEGQRVRFGRAALREEASLVILDEAFRGLERGRRRELLATARQRWREATLLYVTHDVGDIMDLDLVVVVSEGRIVEQGRPSILALRKESRFGSMIALEKDLWKELGAASGWRRLAFGRGRLGPNPGSGAP